MYPTLAFAYAHLVENPAALGAFYHCNPTLAVRV